MKHGLPENVQECLEKFSPKGFVLVYVSPNDEVHAHLNNPDYYTALSDLYHKLPGCQEEEDDSPPDCMEQIVIPL
jgi:hypothetical protein